ncbi:MAG: hypothetical protein ACYS8Z_27350 [Planctomycetota bacterium]
MKWEKYGENNGTLETSSWKVETILNAESKWKGQEMYSIIAEALGPVVSDAGAVRAGYGRLAVVAGFQPDVEKDGDPDTEPVLVRGASKGADNQCVLYLETVINEASAQPLEKHMAHEIGHGGGPLDDACELGCIMYKAPSGMTGDTFCKKCLHDFRKDAEW